MGTGSKLGRRIKLTILIVFVLAIVLGVGEVLRRFFDREERTALNLVLSQAQKINEPLSEIDPQWEAMSKSLPSRLASAPSGRLGLMTHRAVMRVSADIPGAFSITDRPTGTVRYGDLLEREIPVADHPYLWTIEIQGSWDNGPWAEWYRGSWTGGGWSTAEIAMDSALSDEQREQEKVFLKLQAILKLYLGDRAIAAAEADGPEELARVPFVFHERRRLGSYRVWPRGVPTGSQRP